MIVTFMVTASSVFDPRVLASNKMALRIEGPANRPTDRHTISLESLEKIRLRHNVGLPMSKVHHYWRSSGPLFIDYVHQKN